MNKYQMAYAVAKAAHDTAETMYYMELRNNEQRKVLENEQLELLDFVEGTPEYDRATEIEGILLQQEQEVDALTGYRKAQETLRTAEERLVFWAFETLKGMPDVFARLGVNFSDVEGLYPHMMNLYSPIRKKLIDLAFRFAA